MGRIFHLVKSESEINNSVEVSDDVLPNGQNLPFGK